MDELKALATDMQGKGLIPFAFANDGRWPAMGTFDQLNFRMNGYQFHVDLMAGKEKLDRRQGQERVRQVDRAPAVPPGGSERPHLAGGRAGRGRQDRPA